MTFVRFEGRYSLRVASLMVPLGAAAREILRG
jgi:hypothetical protein